MKSRSILTALASQPLLASAAATLELNVTSLTGGTIESDWTAVYYSDSQPLLLGNDGGTSTGGFHAFDLNANTPIPALNSVAVGRTKLVNTVYGVGCKDYALTIAQPDSIIRVFELPGLVERESARITKLGDWSALCSWKSDSGNQYTFLFGKKQAVQFLVRKKKNSVELVEVQTFPLPGETSSCAVSASTKKLFLGMDDDKNVYSIPLAESTAAPELSTFGEAEDAVTGLALYSSDEDYLFIAQENVIAVYDADFEQMGTLNLAGLEDIEVQGLSVFQAATTNLPEGALVYAIEADDVAGFGVSSLDGIFNDLDIDANLQFDPRASPSSPTKNPICGRCSKNGYCLGDKKCACFAGSIGKTCKQSQCEDNCSGNGKCVGANKCECKPGFGGLNCAFIVVEPTYETDANGADGDDPAIWISPEDPEKSRIVTTTKSGEDGGLGVFDLKGNLLQVIEAGEPNNVDILYGFMAGDRKIDLAYAACRADDTLCLFEMTSEGKLKEIPGGSQAIPLDFTVYGSCAYRSPRTGKQYLFVNEKSARYLQFELTSTPDGTLETTLVRDFITGSGGQPEGCVTDEENGFLYLGEEASALWRYGAEPDSSNEGVQVAFVGDGKLFADVEGVTLVQGATPDQGFIIVSIQGVSGYNIYRRAVPNDYVATFTISDSADGSVDHVSNTDGVAAVGTALGPDFPRGLVVVHDDSNELAEGGTSDAASFKLVSLENILGAPGLQNLNLLDEVDSTWDPRAA